MSGKSKWVVDVIGLPLREISVLKCIFKLSSSRAQSYELAPADQAPDIVLVDGDNPEAVREWRALCTRDRSKTTLPTVMVSQADTPPPAPLYALRRPIVTSRVLSTLEQITMQYKDTAPAAVALQHRALVVDDSATTRKQIEIELEQLGIAADLAESGEQAFAFLNQGQGYDLIFLDVVLPGLVDGYNICKTIKRDKQRKRVPVIMLTGKGSPFDRVRGKLAGCNTYLTKPVGRERFQAVVKKYLD
jgi:two-component system, cell cycle response regulator